MKQDDYYKELVNTILDEQGNKQLPPTDSPQAVMLATPAPPINNSPTCAPAPTSIICFKEKPYDSAASRTT
jgi:hypothetical protein